MELELERRVDRHELGIEIKEELARAHREFLKVYLDHVMAFHFSDSPLPLKRMGDFLIGEDTTGVS